MTKKTIARYLSKPEIIGSPDLSFKGKIKIMCTRAHQMSMQWRRGMRRWRRERGVREKKGKGEGTERRRRGEEEANTAAANLKYIVITL